ncbi:MAG: RnfABCDGE type electron transport complex subunit D [Pseudomonadota bacterium]
MNITLPETKKQDAEESNSSAKCPLLVTAVSPHIKSNESVARIMWTVAAALMPALIFSGFVFGLRALIITGVSVAGCIVCEYAVQKILKKPVTIKDGSAAVTGILLAFTLPPGVSLWLPVLGSVMAIGITKQLMGGIGFNVFNPALMARAFLAVSFPVPMTTAWLPVHRLFSGDVDAVTGATSLYVLKHYGMEGLVEKFGAMPRIYLDSLLGFEPGCIGETSAALLLIGGAFLIYKRYITWHIPVSFIATTGVLIWIFGGDKPLTGDPLFAILSGGVMLGAFFMATDYTTCPKRKEAQIIFGAGIGLLSVLIRLKGGYPEGVCYAILLMNALTPTLDSWLKPKRFALPKGTTR